MPDPERIRHAARESDDSLVLVPVTAEDMARQMRRKKAMIAGAMLAVAALGWILYHRAVDPVEAKQTYEDGVRLVHTSRYEQAILNFNRAIDLQSNYADAYKMRGRSYALSGNPDKAIVDFSKVVALRPQEIGVLLDRGFAYMERKDLDAAEADAERVLKLDEKQSRAYNLRATVERARGDRDTAIKDFTRAVDLDPNLDNFFQRGATYQSMGDHKRAVEDFTQALLLAPDQPHSYFARAQSKAALGDVKGAQRDIETGRKIDGW